MPQVGPRAAPRSGKASEFTAESADAAPPRFGPARALPELNDMVGYLGAAHDAIYGRDVARRTLAAAARGSAPSPPGRAPPHSARRQSAPSGASAFGPEATRLDSHARGVGGQGGKMGAG